MSASSDDDDPGARSAGGAPGGGESSLLEWLASFGEAREHLALAQAEFLKVVRAGLVALEERIGPIGRGDAGAPGGAEHQADPRRLAEWREALAAIVESAGKVAEGMLERREAEVRLRALREVRTSLVAERDRSEEGEAAPGESEGGSPRIGLEAALRVLDREIRRTERARTGGGGRARAREVEIE